MLTRGFQGRHTALGKRVGRTGLGEERGWYGSPALRPGGVETNKTGPRCQRLAYMCMPFGAQGMEQNLSPAKKRGSCWNTSALEVVSNPIVVASISLLNWNFSLVFRAGCNLPSCFYASLILPVAHTLNILLRLITVLSIDHSCLTFSNPFLWNFLNP